MNFSCGAFTKHIKDKFKIIHMIAQIFSFQPLQFFVFAWRNTKSGFENFSRQNLIILMVLGPAIFPFVSKSFADNNAAHPFLYPIIAISFEFIKYPCPFCRQFRILYFLYSLIADFGKPALEWLGFRRRDRLNNAKNAFRIGTV